VLLDGTVWLGFESWPTATLPDTVQIATDPEQQRITIASDAPAILPGTIFQGSRISRVEHSIAALGRAHDALHRDLSHGRLRVGQEQGGAGRIVRALVGNTLIGPRVDWLAKYDARVVAQNADGTLELKPDDDRLPSYSGVPIRYGVPGIAATVAAGARVVLEFSGANPQRPIATVWESAWRRRHLRSQRQRLEVRSNQGARSERQQ
jgi:hypothetical protein